MALMLAMWRSLPAPLARSIVLVTVACGLVGASFGAITTSAGFPLWLPMLMSVVVFAGASQFMFIALIVAGTNPFAAMAAGLLANARHFLFGFSIADVFGSSVPKRLLGAHIMVDEAVAFVIAQRGAERRRAAYWVCGTMLFCMWNIGTVLGALSGAAIKNSDAFGLDAALPAVLLALILPSMSDRRVLVAGVIGAVIAVVSTPFLQAGLPILLALAGVAVAFKPPKDEDAHITTASNQP